MSGYRFEPLSKLNWPLLETLFGEKGACGGCWCMAWRLSAKNFKANKGERNKQLLKQLAAQSPSPGIVAVDADGKAVGWIAIAPRKVYERLQASKTLASVDDKMVWSISCFFLHQSVRRQGLSVGLINAAVAFAKQHGATIVEAYPIDTEVSNSKFVPVFNWTGVAKSFERAGFVAIARRSATRPIMRKMI